jgi:hypothetical protein
MIYEIFLTEKQINSKTFLKLIKKKFKIKKITGVITPLIETSGTMKISLNYKLNRKEGLVKLFIKQSQIAEDFFRNQMEERTQREKNFLKESKGIKFLGETKEQLKEIFNTYESVLHQQIKKEIDRIFLVRKRRNSLQFLKLDLQMIITEIKENDISKNIMNLKIENLESETTINLKSRIENVMTKKAKEVFVEVEPEKAQTPNNDVDNVSDNRASSINESQTFANELGGTVKSALNEGNCSEHITKGVRFVLDRANNYLIELNILEKENILVEQFEQHIKDKEDISSSKSLMCSFPVDQDTETKQLSFLFQLSLQFPFQERCQFICEVGAAVSPQQLPQNIRCSCKSPGTVA